MGGLQERADGADNRTGNYTPVASYYKLAKTVEEDPEFDAKK